MKYRYIIIGEDYTVWGTNDEAQAKEASESEIVFNMETGLAVIDKEPLPDYCQSAIRNWGEVGKEE